MDRLTFEGSFCDISRCGENLCRQSCSHKAVWERLKAYEDAEEQGLLVRLPCKVGSVIWIHDRDGKPIDMRLEAPDIRCVCAKEEDLCMSLCDAKGTGICVYRLKNDGGDIGKTVFLTREEAEAALKGGGKDG